MNYIKSKDNEFFKNIKKLSSKKFRDLSKIFLVEGIKCLEYISSYKYVLIKESKKDKFEEYSLKENTFILSDKLFDEVSSQNNSQGIIFIVNFINQLFDENANEVVILDSIQDPGNLGTLLRLIDAVGIKNVILTEGSCDIYNEKVVRSTMGSLFNLNITNLSLNKLSEFLIGNNYTILVTALDSNSITYDKMTVSAKNAIIFGNEGHGVSPQLIDIANEKLIIPIYGKAESLNVGVAAGIFLYKYKELKTN